MTDRSLRLDTAGHPHIVNGENGLHYAWHYELVDGARLVGSYASLALDANGRPHVSYHDGLSSDLKYAFRTPSGW